MISRDTTTQQHMAAMMVGGVSGVMKVALLTEAIPAGDTPIFGCRPAHGTEIILQGHQELTHLGTGHLSVKLSFLCMKISVNKLYWTIKTSFHS